MCGVWVLAGVLLCCLCDGVLVGCMKALLHDHMCKRWHFAELPWTPFSVRFHWELRVSKGDRPAGRYLHTMTRMDHRAVVFGGQLELGDVSADAFLLDLGLPLYTTFQFFLPDELPTPCIRQRSPHFPLVDALCRQVHLGEALTHWSGSSGTLCSCCHAVGGLLGGVWGPGQSGAQR